MNKYLLIIALLLSTTAFAELQHKTIRYNADGIEMNGFLVFDDRYQGKRPGVLVVHEWWGLNDYAKEKAKQLALMGYSAFAIDMYGNGKNTSHPKTAKKFSSAVNKNLASVKNRFQAAMDILSDHETVSDTKLSAIGYCFGGGIVLEMARNGLPLAGVASFHGTLKTSNRNPNIKAKIRIFNGKDDKFISDEQITNFKNEMAKNRVDYKLYNYDNAVHAFTNPQATGVGEKLGIQNLRYDRKADTDSWAKFSQFLSDLYQN